MKKIILTALLLMVSVFGFSQDSMLSVKEFVSSAELLQATYTVGFVESYLGMSRLYKPNPSDKDAAVINQIARHISRNLRSTCQRLVDLGKSDNITVIMVAFILAQEIINNAPGFALDFLLKD